MRRLAMDFLVIFFPRICVGIRVVQTDPSLEIPVRTGQAEILNSAMVKHPEFTICARFKTHQFSWHRDTYAYHSLVVIPPNDWLLGAYVTFPCDDFFTGCTQRYKDIHGNKWKHSGVLGYVGDGVYNWNFPAWQPGVWTSGCVRSVPQQGHFTVVINGHPVLETTKYKMEFLPGRNIVLMNDGEQWGGLPNHGEMTDVNVWSRILTLDEIRRWESCEEETSMVGDVVSWDTAILNLTIGVSVREEEKTKICLNKSERKTFKAFKSTNTFTQMTKLCRNLGGGMAVAEDAGALAQMENTFQDVCNDKQFFYAGFTDRKEDRKWINVNNEEPLAWDNWAEKNPVNFSHHDCITARIGRKNIRIIYFPKYICPRRMSLSQI